MTLAWKAVKVYFVAGLIIAGMMLLLGPRDGVGAAKTGVVTVFTGFGVAVGLTDDAAEAVQKGQTLTGDSGSTKS